MTTPHIRQMTIFRPPCLFKLTTHLYCPGCGGTRAVLALLHGRILQSLQCNPTVLYIAVMSLWCILGEGIYRTTGKQMRWMKPKLWMLILGVILFFGFGIARDILLCCYGYDYLGDLT